MICTNCNREYAEDPCPYCGSFLQDASAYAKAPPPPEPTPEVPDCCPICGTVYSTDATFCSICLSCGAPKQAPEPIAPTPEPFVYTPLYVFNPNYVPPKNPVTANCEHYHHVMPKRARLSFGKRMLVLLLVIVGMFSYFVAPTAAIVLTLDEWPFYGGFITDFAPPSGGSSGFSGSDGYSGSNGSNGSSSTTPSTPDDSTSTDTDEDPLPTAPDDAVDEGESVYPNGISIAEYRQLELGMTYAEVSAILGGDGTLQGTGEDPETGATYVQFAWIAEYNTSAYVVMLFEDQQLSMVYQEGLF